MPWQHLQARVEKQSLDHVESVLLLAGASSISLLDAEDQPLLEPVPGTTPLWDTILVEALFPADSNLAPLRTVLGQIGANDVAIRILDDDDWVARSQALDQPLQFGKHLWVIPDANGTPSAATDDQRRVQVNMVPGLAFGSGLHPTTALCLEWLDANPPLRQRVLDYGCGSGILGLAALKLGADSVSMVDIDPQAITASQRNAERNGVDAGLWVGEPSNLTATDFDLLVANILANPLLALAERFAELVLPGGSLLLTGLLDTQEQLIKDAYDAWFSDWSAAHQDGWLCLHSKRSAHT